MRTIRTKVYKFNELPTQQAKEKAIQWFRESNQNFGYAWADEINESFEEVVNHVVKPLRNIEEEISGARLYAWIGNNLSHLWTKQIVFSKHADGKMKKSTFAYKYDQCVKFRRSRIQQVNEIDNCPFTGVCYDHDFLQPVIDFMLKPSKYTTNFDIADEIETLIDKVHENEREAQDSHEYIIDIIEANEYEFTKDGDRFTC